MSSYATARGINKINLIRTQYKGSSVILVRYFFFWSSFPARITGASYNRILR